MRSRTTDNSFSHGGMCRLGQILLGIQNTLQHLASFGMQDGQNPTFESPCFLIHYYRHHRFLLFFRVLHPKGLHVNRLNATGQRIAPSSSPGCSRCMIVGWSTGHTRGSTFHGTLDTQIPHGLQTLFCRVVNIIRRWVFATLFFSPMEPTNGGRLIAHGGHFFLCPPKQCLVRFVPFLFKDARLNG